MLRRTGAICASSLVMLAIAGSAAAKGEKPAPNTPSELPRCAAPLARVAVQAPESRWWVDLGLSDPEGLLKTFALRSGCLRIIDRDGAARSQGAAPDFIVILDVARTDTRTSGRTAGAAAGAVSERVGGRAGGLGGLASGLRTKKVQAQALITLIDAKSGEQIYLAEGSAQKTDITYEADRGPAWAGLAAAAGSAYADTDIGRVVSAAYFSAYRDLVRYLQERPAPPPRPVAPEPPQVEAKIELRAYRVTKALTMREQPSPSSSDVRSFSPNEVVYPTGRKDGVWWEVDDENGNRGWVSSAFVAPRS